MAKIMLVEDDNNLREIYEARLAAEGYEIVSAADGEAALALGIKEKPDLIIADIMMPKVSGFDMLDIMRSTTETKNAKIIMMTALNQAEDKAKAEKLGADLYLVKSQVTLEDVVRSAKKLLGEETPLSIGGAQVTQPAQAPNQTTAAATPMNTTTPPVPATQQPPTPQPSQPTQDQGTQQPQGANSTQNIPINSTPASNPPEQPNSNSKPPNKNAASTADEEAVLQQQIQQFISEENPTISTDPNSTVSNPPATQPTILTPPPQNQQQNLPQPQPEPQPNSTDISQAQVTPTSQSAPQSTPPSMAAPPKDLPQNNPQTTALGDDLPAGDRVLKKSADASSPDSAGINQNAELSGRKKVIQPISDVLTKGPDMNALLAKEANSQPGTAPTVNSVVSPDGITSTPSPQQAPGTNPGTTMSDVIAPNPQAASQPEPNNPPAPPVA